MIRYANPSFRAAFFPAFDGRPADFITTIVAAMKAGTGLRIDSALPEEFAAAICFFVDDLTLQLKNNICNLSSRIRC